MKRNRNGNRGYLQTPLHDLMTASLAYHYKSVLFENATNFRAGKNPKLTQPVPQPGSRKPRCVSVVQFPMRRRFRKKA
jgi:hypothetical protein